MAEFRPTPTLLKRYLCRIRQFGLCSYMHIPRVTFTGSGAYELSSDKVILSLDLNIPRTIQLADWKSSKFAMDDVAYYAFISKIKEVRKWFTPDAGIFMYSSETNELILDEEMIDKKYGGISKCVISASSLYGRTERTITFKPVVMADPDSTLVTNYVMVVVMSMEDPMASVLATRYDIQTLAVALSKFSYTTEPLILMHGYELAIKAGNVSRGNGMTQQSVIDNTLNGSLTDARISSGVIKTNPTVSTNTHVYSTEKKFKI